MIRLVRVAALMMIFGAPGAAQTWVQKISGSGLGNSLQVNPLNPDILYGATGSRFIYISRDRGYTWQQYGNPVPQIGAGTNAVKSIAVNPNDTLQLLAGVESGSGEPDQVMKSTDGGFSWSTTWGGTFYYYGRPVEFKTQHPDTVYTMGNDTLWRSTDFGSTWDTVTIRRAADFNAWCDAEIRPDSANIIFLGDAGTGIWKSTDYGVSWRRVYTALSSGEIPAIAIDPFTPRRMYATRFSGGGGVIKSTDGGETWHDLTTPVGISSTWWITCSAVHPNYVYFGVFFTGTSSGIYVSRDAGATWTNFDAGLSSTAKFNFGLLALDSLTVLATQQTGLYRLEYTPTIHISTPNGGEIYTSGLQHTIEWTASNLYAVRVEYTSDEGANWTTIADSLPASVQSYDWIIPPTASSHYRIRVSDRLFTSAADTSDADFFVTPFTLSVPNGGEQWGSGSYRQISWSPSEFSSIDLLYSLDSGGSWHYITRLPQSVHDYQWYVPPGISSALCKIRVVSSIDSNLYDESDGVFAIAAPPTFHAFLTFVDGGAERDSLAFGTFPGASAGIDTSLGETERAPKPPAGTFDVRWFVPPTLGTSLDLRDTLSAAHEENVYVAELQPGSGGYPITVSWNIDSLDASTFTLRDSTTHGAILRVDMKKQDSVVIADTSVRALEIVDCRNIVITYGSFGGWNLLSVPLEVSDMRKASLFPYSLSEAFAYNGNYVVRDTLVTGVGYWVKLEQAAVVGCVHAADTVAVVKGWNMIGSVSSPVATSAIIAVPDTIVASSYFGYAGGYEVASVIDPGGGYWVKTNAPGKLVIASSSSSAFVRPKQGIPDGISRLRISEAAGGSQTLYFGSEHGMADPGRYEMPPVPPPGVFDARFADQKMAEMVPENLQNDLDLPILIAPGFDQIFFGWSVENDEKFSYILVEKSNNREISATPLKGHGSLEVHRRNQSAFAVKVRKRTETAEGPADFELGEVYPNPFNPTAYVRYRLPVVSHVNVSVYSLLGAEVAVLADGVESSGMYTAEWNGRREDGTPAGSGVYFIRMYAVPLGSLGPGTEPYQGVRRMLLLK